MSISKDLQLLSERLQDSRSKRVAFVSHCILNENARYQGGAFRPGCNLHIVAELQRREIGVVQMRCSEQKAWGGVLRKLMWLPIRRHGTWLYRLRGVFLPVFIAYTRWASGRIARETASEIEDWARSGYTVVGIIGVAASPSCGVHKTLDVRLGADYIARLDPAAIERQRFNVEGIRAAVVDGRGRTNATH